MLLSSQIKRKCCRRSSACTRSACFSLFSRSKGLGEFVFAEDDQQRVIVFVEEELIVTGLTDCMDVLQPIRYSTSSQY